MFVKFVVESDSPNALLFVTWDRMAANNRWLILLGSLLNNLLIIRVNSVPKVWADAAGPRSHKKLCKVIINDKNSPSMYQICGRAKVRVNFSWVVTCVPTDDFCGIEEIVFCKEESVRIYIFSSTERLIRCITTLQCGLTREMLQAGIENR